MDVPAIFQARASAQDEEEAVDRGQWQQEGDEALARIHAVAKRRPGNRVISESISHAGHSVRTSEQIQLLAPRSRGTDRPGILYANGVRCA